VDCSSEDAASECDKASLKQLGMNYFKEDGSSFEGVNQEVVYTGSVDKYGVPNGFGKL